jgi:hypothetical protein
MRLEPLSAVVFGVSWSRRQHNRTALRKQRRKDGLAVGLVMVWRQTLDPHRKAAAIKSIRHIKTKGVQVVDEQRLAWVLGHVHGLGPQPKTRPVWALCPSTPGKERRHFELHLQHLFFWARQGRDARTCASPNAPACGEQGPDEQGRIHLERAFHIDA